MGSYQVDTEDGHSYVVETEDPIPSYPKVNLPAELQGGPVSKFRQAMTNLPSSLVNTITHPSFPGMPSEQETLKGTPTYMGGKGITPPSPLYDVKQAAHGLMHPEEDPVGAGLNVAALGRAAGRFGKATTIQSPEGVAETVVGGMKGAVKGGMEPTPVFHRGLSVDVPKSLAGAGIGGFLGHYTYLPHGNEIGAAIGSAAPMIKGGMEGAREAVGNIQDRNPPIVQPPTQQFPPSRQITSGSIKPEPPPDTSGPIEPKLPENYKTPQEAASKDSHMPGATQADEFKVAAPSTLSPQGGPIVKPPNQVQLPNLPPMKPIGGNISPGGPSTETATEVMKPGTAPPGEALVPQVPKVNSPYAGHPAHANIDEGLKTKIPNVIAHAKAEGYKLEELKQLEQDATQADDPEKQFNAMQEIKQLGQGAHARAKLEGRPVPSSKYKGMSLYTLGEVIKAWPKE